MPSIFPPQQSLADRVKRKEAVGNLAIRVIGVLSALGILVGFGIVIRKNEQLHPKLEWGYIEKIYGADLKGHPKPAVSTTEEESKVAALHASDVVDFSTPAAPGHRAVTTVAAVDMSRSSKGESPAATRAAVENLEAKKEEIGGVVRDFFSAKSISELLPLVRDARLVRPLMEDYYSRTPLVRKEWKSLGMLTAVDEPGYKFAFVQAIFQSGPASFVVVEETDIGFLVDWESAVCYSESGWKDFIRQHPATPTLFRLLASRAEEDKPVQLVSGKQQMTLKMRHPLEDGLLNVTFDPSDPAMLPLIDQLAARNWMDAPITVHLSFAPDSPPDTAQVTSIEGKGWLMLRRAK